MIIIEYDLVSFSEFFIFFVDIVHLIIIQFPFVFENKFVFLTDLILILRIDPQLA